MTIILIRIKRFRYIFNFILVPTLIITACSQQNGNGDAGYKSINGTEIYYKTMGVGEPMIVVHGGPELSHHYLLAYLKPLAGDYKLIFYDQRLSGRSSAEVHTGDITIANYVDDIEELRKSFNLDKIYLLGHDWGGLLAMEYAIKYPQHLKKLILADPMPASAALWQREEIELAGRRTAADRKVRQKILNSKAYRKNQSAAIEKLQLLSFKEQFHDPALADSLDLYIPEDYAKRSRLFGHLMPELQNYNLYPALAKIQIPTLILYGADEPIAKSSGNKLNNTIPHSTLKIIKNSGHFPFIERPEPFFGAVRQFLKSSRRIHEKGNE